MNILSINLYSASIPLFIPSLIKYCDEKQNKLISATGAHGIIISQKDKNFNTILNSFYVNLPDGMPSVWVGRLKGAKEMQRCYGSNFLLLQ